MFSVENMEPLPITRFEGTFGCTKYIVKLINHILRDNRLDNAVVIAALHGFTFLFFCIFIFLL